MTKKTKNNKNTINSILITLAVLLLMIIAGPAQAVKLALINPSSTAPSVGEMVTFEAHIDLNSDEIVPVKTIILDVNGTQCEFSVNGGVSLTPDLVCQGFTFEKNALSPFGTRVPEKTFYSNDFEQGYQGWTHAAINGADSWEITTVAYGSDDFVFDSNVVGSTNNGNHAGFEQSYLMSPMMVLPEEDNLYFTFNSYTANEGGCPLMYDVEWVEIHNGGDEWIRLNNCGDDDGNDFLHLEADMKWREFSYDITEFGGQAVFFRFKYSTYDESGGPTNQEGWYVDNVEITTKLDYTHGFGFGDSVEENNVTEDTIYYSYGYGYGYDGKWGFGYNGEPFPSELSYFVSWNTSGYSKGTYLLNFYAEATDGSNYFKYKTKDTLVIDLNGSEDCVGDDCDDDCVGDDCDDDCEGDDCDDDCVGDDCDDDCEGDNCEECTGLDCCEPDDLTCIDLNSSGGGTLLRFRPKPVVENETVDIGTDGTETNVTVEIQQNVTDSNGQGNETEEEDTTEYETGTLNATLFNFFILLMFLVGLLILIAKNKKSKK